MFFSKKSPKNEKKQQFKKSELKKAEKIDSNDSDTSQSKKLYPLARVFSKILATVFDRRNSGKLATVLVVCGVLVTLYPVVATLIMNQSQIDAVAEVKKAGKNLGLAERKKIWQSAEEYNKKLQSGPILDPFLERVAPNTKVYREYLKQISLGSGIMGSVSIPSIHTSLPIYHGTYDRELELGAGHLFGSSLPIGGRSTHAVITAHSGLGEATMFDYLPDAKVGDRVYIDILGEKLVYRITSKEIVVPTDTKSLYVQQGKDLITLVTCTPYGINTHRLLVHAERIPLDNQAKVDDESRSYAWRYWMLLPIVLSVAAIIALCLLIRYFPKKGKTKKIDLI